MEPGRPGAGCTLHHILTEGAWATCLIWLSPSFPTWETGEVGPRCCLLGSSEDKVNQRCGAPWLVPGQVIRGGWALWQNPGSPSGQDEWESQDPGSGRAPQPHLGLGCRGVGLPGTHRPSMSSHAGLCLCPGCLSPPPPPLGPLPSKDRHCFGNRALDSWNKLCLATLLDTEVSNPMEYEFNFQLEIRGPCLLAGEWS